MFKEQHQTGESNSHVLMQTGFHGRLDGLEIDIYVIDGRTDQQRKSIVWKVDQQLRISSWVSNSHNLIKRKMCNLLLILHTDTYNPV